MLTLLFVVPIGYMLVTSVTDPRLSLAHYQRIFTVPLYTQVMLNTFLTSLIVTALCLVLGYPVAYVMARRTDWVSTCLLTIVAMSFWTGFLVRTYAWLVILGSKGPVVATYQALGLGTRTEAALHELRLDTGHDPHPPALHDPRAVRRHEEDRARPPEGRREPRRAAAGGVHGRVPPLSLPGVVNGSLLVFVTCLGFFVTPILLGTPRDMMISQLINQQIEELLAWGFASAVAVVLLVATGLILAVYNRFAGLDRLWG